LTGKIVESFKRKVTGLTLIPATGGCFELTVDGELVYSKLATGEFPNEMTIMQTLQTKVKK
jgi:selenoprotein W-related protein